MLNKNNLLKINKDMWKYISSIGYFIFIKLILVRSGKIKLIKQLVIRYQLEL